MLDKGPSGLKVLVQININVKTSLLLQYRQEFEDYLLMPQVSLEDALSNVNALHEQSLEGTQQCFSLGQGFYDNPF